MEMYFWWWSLGKQSVLYCQFSIDSTVHVQTAAAGCTLQGVLQRAAYPTFPLVSLISIFPPLPAEVQWRKFC